MRKICVLLLLLCVFAAHGESCEPLLAGDDGYNAELNSYLNVLFEERVLTVRDLHRIAYDIEAGREPRLDSMRAGTTAQRIHARELRNQLALADPAQLAQWLRQKINLSVRQSFARAQIGAVTKPRAMAFVRFEIDGEIFANSTVHNFEIMDTPVTQAMWENVMGKNPAHFKNDGATQPNHPIENISWSEAAEFANRVSVKNGLPPFYQLNRLRLDKGWLFISDRREISKVGGFRLPSHLEILWLQVMTAIQRHSLTPATHAWYAANSDGHTHPVGQLRPSDHEEPGIYDFYGNVTEWMSDWTSEDGLVGPLVNGGAYNADKDAVVANKRTIMDPCLRSSEIGFRLVRTVK